MGGCAFSSPFLGTFFQWQENFRSAGANSSFRPLSWGLSFNKKQLDAIMALLMFSSPFLGTFFQYGVAYYKAEMVVVFVPFLGDFLSILSNESGQHYYHRVFVPFLGDFLSIACLRSPSPSALASAFAAGMGGSLHQALSFGDEMPIFPDRAGIGGGLP